MPHPGLLHPESLPLWQATADPYLHKRHSSTQRQVWLSLCWVFCVHKVLFEPSERLWQVWGLILNMISPLLPSCWGSSLLWDAGYLLIVAPASAGDGRLSHLSLLFFGTLHSNGYIFPFLLCLPFVFFSQLFVRPPQTTILPSCVCFSWGWS